MGLQVSNSGKLLINSSGSPMDECCCERWHYETLGTVQVDYTLAGYAPNPPADYWGSLIDSSCAGFTQDGTLHVITTDAYPHGGIGTSSFRRVFSHSRPLGGQWGVRTLAASYTSPVYDGGYHTVEEPNAGYAGVRGDRFGFAMYSSYDYVKNCRIYTRHLNDPWTLSGENTRQCTSPITFTPDEQWSYVSRGRGVYGAGAFSDTSLDDSPDYQIAPDGAQWIVYNRYDCDPALMGVYVCRRAGVEDTRWNIWPTPNNSTLLGRLLVAMSFDSDGAAVVTVHSGQSITDSFLRVFRFVSDAWTALPDIPFRYGSIHIPRVVPIAPALRGR